MHELVIIETGHIDTGFKHEVCIRLLVDNKCNEQRAAAAGQKYYKFAFFLVVRRFRRERRHFCEFFFHDIFSDTSKFPVLKQANLHVVFFSCFLSLFVAVNILDHPDAGFNSCQVPQSNSKSSSYPPLFQDRKTDF